MKSVRNLELKDKRVLIRVDFNVPMDDEKNISDDIRMKMALPTLQYIRDQGAGDLIKNEVSFSFGRGQDIEAKQVKEMFRENGYEPSEKEGIQWNTLDAWVRESLQKAAEKGEPFPEETFGVFRTNDVTIKT